MDCTLALPINLPKALLPNSPATLPARPPTAVPTGPKALPNTAPVPVAADFPNVLNGFQPHSAIRPKPSLNLSISTPDSTK